jgi:hypothetical protein
MPQILPSLLKQAHAIQVELVRHTTDPVAHRKAKFVAALKDQLTLLDNAKSTKSARRRRKQPDGTYAQTDVQIKIKPMWREDAKGNVILQPRYGNSNIEFEKGKVALMAGEKSKLSGVIKQLITAVEQGELDQLLAKASEGRKRPKSKVKQAA